MPVQLIQQQAQATQTQIDRLHHWIVIVPDKPGPRIWRELPYGSWLARRTRQLPEAQRGKPQRFELPNAAMTQVACAGCAADSKTFDLLTLARKLVALLWPFEPHELAISTAGFEVAAAERIIEAVISALLAAAAGMPEYKHKPSPTGFLRRIRWLGGRAEHGFRRAFAEAEGNALARYLATLPPNKLTPGEYRRRVEQLAREHGWDTEFFDTAALKRRRAGAFLSVVRGSAVADAGILHLTYKPRADGGCKVALVGKGICYDTGGINVKPNKYMLGMHGDMQGSAVALGTLLALTRLEAPLQLDVWMALAANHIGSHAYTPNEVVKAADGTTIEVIHTDAEGRMILADTLVFASRARPDLLIDYATLTGSCVQALGTAYAGVFCNRDAWLATLIETGRASGERVWPFPQDADYAEAIESTIADVKQCAVEDGVDHILAACFLGRFIQHQVPWIHIDLSSADRKGGLAHVPTPFTGFGVRFTCALLLDQELPG